MRGGGVGGPCCSKLFCYSRVIIVCIKPSPRRSPGNCIYEEDVTFQLPHSQANLSATARNLVTASKLAFLLR